MILPLLRKNRPKNNGYYWLYFPFYGIIISARKGDKTMARYINADMAIDKIHALRIKYATEHKDIDNPFNIFWECCDSILQTQTADVREVVHGYWIQRGDTDIDGNALFKCSVCDAGDLHVPTQKVPYCWKCGAKMA